MEIFKLDQEEWSHKLKNFSHATFFHTPDWYNLWHNYYGYNFACFYLVFGSGNEVVFPIAWRKRIFGFINEFFSSPIQTYGGFLYKNFPDDSESTKLKEFFSGFKNITLRENPYLKSPIDLNYTNSDHTLTLSLDREFDEIVSGWSKGHYSAAKKGIRDGVKISIASGSDWQEYYEVYMETWALWKNRPMRPYTVRFFEYLQDLDPNKCKLWIAKAGGKLIAGCLCFYYNNHVVYWHGASLQEYKQFKPVHTLQYHIIGNAKKQNFRWYDFNPSGGHQGVVKFKQGFGARRLKSDIFERESTLLRVAKQLSNGIRFF